MSECVVKGDADFSVCTVGGGVNVESSQWSGEFKLDGTRIERDLLCNSAEFLGEVSLLKTQIGGAAKFISAQFKDQVCLLNTEIGADWLSSQASFSGPLIFCRSRIKGDAFFSECVFGDKVVIQGNHFAHDVVFSSAQAADDFTFAMNNVGGLGGLANTHFDGDVDFRGSLFSGDLVLIGSSATGPVALDFVRCERALRWSDARYESNVSLEGAEFGSIIMAESPGRPFEFGGSIDLRECRYNRVEPVNAWSALVERVHPYHRQPYTQLETTLRQAGYDSDADAVYYARRRMDSQKLSFGPSWLVDRFLWLFTGYGTTVQRLMYVILPLLAIGIGIFTLVEGAAIKIGSQVTVETTPSVVDSTILTFSLFIPIFDIVGVTWAPNGIYKLVALFLLTIPGWILVPVALAGITGFLKR